MRVAASRHVFPRHAHETYYIIGVIEEGASFCCGPEHEESLAAPGDLFLINPGRIHSGVPAAGRPVSYTMLAINHERFFSLVNATIDQVVPAPEFPLTLRGPASLRALLRQAYRALAESANALARDEALHELTAAILPFARNRATARPGPAPKAAPGIVRAEERICADLEGVLNLETLANEAGMSPYHFLRTFKRVYGLPPHKYRSQKRIGQAKAFLRSGYPHSEIALRLGYYDQSHFSNAFHAYTGMTPSLYMAGI